MAGENGRIARYNRVIREPIPEFQGDIERLFVSVLKSYSKKYNVEDKDVAYSVIYQLTKNMSRRMRKRYWDDTTLWKIMQIRRQFVLFRRFISRPYVGYDEVNNRVHVSPEYYAIWPNRREPVLYRSFRLNGCPNYNNLKIIFVWHKFHLLNDEPHDLFWREIPERAGDEPVPIYFNWSDDDEDSDDDSDFANEFDD